MLAGCGAPNPSPPPQATAPASEQVTKAEVDLVLRQIARCWDPPIEAKGTRGIVVDIAAEVGADGRVKSAQIISTARMGEPASRAAAESALRALLNPQCSPLALPAEKYEQWKTLDLRFNPKDAL